MGNAAPVIVEQPQPVAAGSAPDARSPRLVTARLLAIAAAFLGVAYATVSLVWGLGGSWLLDTVGGELAIGGRTGATLIVLALWAAIVLKLIASAIPILAVSPAVKGKLRKHIRLVCGVEAIVLTTYGLVLTMAGVLVHFGVIQAAADADHRAIAWHAFLWDPWFAAWGILVTATLFLSRRRSVG